jgi:Tripartite tricarboxylate transporter family receptor
MNFHRKETAMKEPRDEFIPYWLQTAMPAGNGGILAKLAEPAGNGGILGKLAELAVEPRSETPVLPMTPPPLPLPLLPSPFRPARPLEHLDAGKYWPVAPASLGTNERPVQGFYLPEAPSWDHAPSYLADGAAPSSSQQQPNPTSWGTSMPGVSPTGYSRAEESDLARQAYDAGAKRLQRGVRGRTTAPYEPPARDPAADAGEPGLTERIRLNGLDSFYRGTLMGAGRLALMQHYASTPGPGSGTDIVGRTVAEQLSTQLGQTIIVETRVGAGGTIGSERSPSPSPTVTRC